MSYSRHLSVRDQCSSATGMSGSVRNQTFGQMFDLVVAKTIFDPSQTEEDEPSRRTHHRGCALAGALAAGGQRVVVANGNRPVLLFDQTVLQG